MLDSIVRVSSDAFLFPETKKKMVLCPPYIIVRLNIAADYIQLTEVPVFPILCPSLPPSPWVPRGECGFCSVNSVASQASWRLNLMVLVVVSFGVFTSYIKTSSEKFNPTVSFFNTASIRFVQSLNFYTTSFLGKM